MGSVYFSLGKAISLYINTVTQPINLDGDCVRVNVSVNPKIGYLAGSLPRNLAKLVFAVHLCCLQNYWISSEILVFICLSEISTIRSVIAFKDTFFKVPEGLIKNKKKLQMSIFTACNNRDIVPLAKYFTGISLLDEKAMLMFHFRYRICLPVAVSRLFRYHRQPKALNVNVKCDNTLNLINQQLKPITFVYSRLFVAQEIPLMAR